MKTLIVLCLFAELALATIPPYIKICSRNDPNLSKCVINSVEELRPKLKSGIPELNVPGVEPLFLDEVKLRSGPNQAKINANITNIKVYGPSDFEILDLRVNLKKNKFIFRVNVPKIYFEGDYDIDMSLLLLNYKGQGPITGNFTDYKFDCTMNGNLIDKNGQKFLKFRKFDVTLYLGHSYMHLGNLFSETSSTIARATNEVVRDNADLFVNEIKPVLEDSLAQKFTDIANIITDRFSYDELFPVTKK
ncbi:putative beta-carotene-binding protein [Sitophilus oryzae]|uniref:Beta-carotene-binding protein n=1 Tax=Sitophilus oryzae TaxID=7048 RepID=A0A6J2YU47_SITOR|nr:putative beta-carotene-binding protein [Sitophilus oryzae]